MSKRVQYLRDLEVPDDLFVPIKTGKLVDKAMSSMGGVMPGTNLIFVGSPGVGKSTVLMDMLCDIQETGKKVMFISGEMIDKDVKFFCKRFDRFNDLPIVFLSQEVANGGNPKRIIEQELSEGYDVVLLDSWAEIVEAVRGSESGYVSKKGTDSWLLNLMARNNDRQNKEKKPTTFLAVQQVTKNDQFAGSNRLKHMTTGMFHMKFDSSDQTSRYLHFSKNRRGGMMDRFYFDVSGTGGEVQWTGTQPLNME